MHKETFTHPNTQTFTHERACKHMNTYTCTYAETRILNISSHTIVHALHFNSSGCGAFWTLFGAWPQRHPVGHLADWLGQVGLLQGHLWQCKVRCTHMCVCVCLCMHMRVCMLWVPFIQYMHTVRTKIPGETILTHTLCASIQAYTQTDWQTDRLKDRQTGTSTHTPADTYMNTHITHDTSHTHLPQVLVAGSLVYLPFQSLQVW
jgi:hypothetical protein